AVIARAEVNAVHVKLENLLFRILRLNMPGEHRFQRLAIKRAGVQFAGVPREVLRDGAAPLLRFASSGVGDERAQHALKIDAMMLPKTCVLPCEQRLDEPRRNRGKRNDVTVLAA